MKNSISQLVERYFISKTNPLFNELDDLCFKSKNLYNATLYAVRQHYFEHNEYLNYYAVNKEFTHNKQNDYVALPAKVSNMTQQLVDKNFKSFFALLKLKQQGKYNKPVKLPKYLDSEKGRQVVHYGKQALSFKRPGYLKLSKTEIYLPTKMKREEIQFLRLVPKGNYIIVEIGYLKMNKPMIESNNYAFIDVGLNNLMTVTSNCFNPIIYNGKPLKSINQFYHKAKSKKMSQLEKVNKTKWSNSLNKLTLWRHHQIKNYLHKATSDLMNQLVSNHVSTLIVGRNKGWKQDINLGRKNNQNFVSIPMADLYLMLSYKCKLNGINYIEVEENHTSKCSFLDREDICHHDSYLGKRVKRGLFRSSLNYYINADINGSLNIGRKYLSTLGMYSHVLHNQLVTKMINPKTKNIR